MFLLMDAMRHPTPVLRIGFALSLTAHFGISVLSRSTQQYGAEQHPLFDTTGPISRSLMGIGNTTKQATICSIDWTITLMLFSSIVSVINYPDEMVASRVQTEPTHAPHGGLYGEALWPQCMLTSSISGGRPATMRHEGLL